VEKFAQSFISRRRFFGCDPDVAQHGADELGKESRINLIAVWTG